MRPEMSPLGRTLTGLSALSLGLAWTCPAQAHAFGERYDLPLPLQLYLAGAGAAVGLSFVVMALFLRGRDAERPPPRLRLWRLPQRPPRSRVLLGTALDCLWVGAFLLIVAAGLLGSQDPSENIAPVTVWIVWWVGMAFVSALVGNVWRLINPWDIVFRWFETALERLWPGRTQMGRVRYPTWLGAWPAVLLFVVFAWLELLWVGRAVPVSLAGVILAYSLVTWAGMFVFGRPVWLERGEVFTLVFSIFARFAPFVVTRNERSAGLYLRPYAVGLLVDRPVSASFMTLVLAMLSTVTFDGFVETRAWIEVLDRAMFDDTVRHLVLSLDLSPRETIVAIKTVALVAFPLLFLAAYIAIAGLVGLAGRLGGGGRKPLGLLAGTFVLSLVPIAIAYHLAHYLLYLLQTGQLVIPLVSDPFGFGWDLFGTAAYQTRINVMDAKSAWYLALGAIVLAHVLAVYLAHVTALRVYRAPGPALWSQVPMVALMVAYTVTSLWILSQPVVA